MKSFSSDPEPSNEEETAPHEPRLLTRRRDDDHDEVPAATTPAHARLFATISRFKRTQLRQPSKRARPFFVLRKLVLTSTIFILLLLIGLVSATLWLRHSMRAALPQIDGTLHVAGLSAPVTVTRDAQGVPTIHAANLDDLLLAQGYITAQDRLWQMDALRRHGAGDLAEILGPGMVDHDRRQRILQLRNAADRAIAVLPPDQLHQLEAYARGVNDFIATNSGNLPVEFHFLHYSPTPWTPRDSILISISMWQDLSTGFPEKINREALSAHLPPTLLADLYPVGSWRDRPPTQPAPDLTAPRDEVQQIPLDETQSSLHQPAPLTATPQDRLTVYRAMNEGRCESCRSGSNNWAVSAARSDSGAPLVSNDMHLGLNAPDIWYEAALHSADAATPFDAEGFTLPGIPFIITGRNAHVAWGVTNLGADVQDVRIEHLRGSAANTEFQRPDGSWAPVTHHPELIRVRGGRNITLDVLCTSMLVGPNEMQTPVISPLYPSEHRTLSLAWAIYDPTALTAPFFAVDTATSGSALVAAFSSFGGPTLNLVYADDANHIGYQAIGRIPIRGPAVEHPRETPQTAIPTGGAPPADEEDQADESQDESAPIGPTPLPTESTPAPSLMYTIGSPLSDIPVDALDASQQWSGYIPYDALPAIVDPANGTLATANARITPDDFPYFVADNWADPYRVERINHLLANRSHLTPSDMLAVENDVHSEVDLALAQRLAYAVDHASPDALAHDTTRLHQAADLLRNSNGEVSADSPAAAIAVATRAELWPMLLSAHIAAHDHTSAGSAKIRDLAALYTWGESNTALELLLLHTPARWLPSGYPSWNDLLAAALERSLSHANAPANLATWRYGQYHPVEIAHPVFGSNSLLSRILGTRTGTGRQPAPGDGVTVRAAALHFGPSERFTADLSSPDLTNANITTGQSENPLSPWFLDQFQPWLQGTTFQLPLNHPETRHTLTLQPN